MARTFLRPILWVSVLVLTASCETNLPPLETSPNWLGPTISDIDSHISCELAVIANAVTTHTMQGELSLGKSEVIVGSDGAAIDGGFVVMDPEKNIPQGTVVAGIPTPITTNIAGTINSDTPTIIVASAPPISKVVNGMAVSGAGIAADTKVTSHTASTIILDKAAKPEAGKQFNFTGYQVPLSAASEPSHNKSSEIHITGTIKADSPANIFASTPVSGVVRGMAVVGPGIAKNTKVYLVLGSTIVLNKNAAPEMNQRFTIGGPEDHELSFDDYNPARLRTALNLVENTGILGGNIRVSAEYIDVTDEVNQLMDRLAAAPQLIWLLPYIAEYHFVATGQLTLEVTDTEGLSPSFSYLTPGSLSQSRSWTFAGPVLNGTQDRSLSVNYSIDMAHLYEKNWNKDFCLAPKPRSFATRLLENTGFTGGIAGNLGLIDIISDGLIAVDDTSEQNVYGSSGPAPPTVLRPVVLPRGKLGKIDKTLSRGLTGTVTASLDGTILVSPPAVGAVSPASVTLNGIVTLTPSTGSHESFRYVANLTGTVVHPSDTDKQKAVPLFSLSGTMSPQSLSAISKEAFHYLGFSPTLSLTGAMDRDAQVSSLAGMVTPSLPGAPTDAYTITFAQTQTPPPSSSEYFLPNAVTFSAAAGGAKPASGGGTGGGGGGASAAGGTTSFGSLVDFTVNAGINGGPEWTLTGWKYPTGSGAGASGNQLAGVNRQRLDSLSITFVAACQNSDDSSTEIYTYWQAIPQCDSLGTLQGQSAAAGLVNDLIMYNRTLIRP